MAEQTGWQKHHEMNRYRLVAADIIHKLWQAGETTQLELLRDQAAASIEKPYEHFQQTEDTAPPEGA